MRANPLTAVEVGLPVPPRRDGSRAVSPTDVSQFVRLEQCQRYFRLRLHERAAGPRFLRDYGVTAQELPPLLTRAGGAFEAAVERGVAARYPVVNLAAKATDPLKRGDDNARVLEAARELPAGAVQVLFQPRLQVRLGAWTLRGDIDILRLERDGAGALHLLIADMKSSLEARVEHRLQVAFYLEMLEALLREAAVAVASLQMAILYRGALADAATLSAEEQATRAQQRAEAQRLFGTDAGFLEVVADAASYRGAARDLVLGPESAAARIAAANFADLPYHLAPKCDGCLYNAFCMKWSAAHDDLSLLPHLTATEKRALQQAGIATTRDLAALKDLASPPDGTPNQEPSTPATAVGAGPHARPDGVAANDRGLHPEQGGRGGPPLPGSAIQLPPEAPPPRTDGAAPADADPAQPTTWDLVPAPGKAALVEQLAATWPVGPRLDELIHRARRYRHYLKEDVAAPSYIPSKGYGSLPYCAPDHNPNLVRIYLDAQNDYLHDRVYLLSALVTGCEHGEPDPARRRSVVRLSAAPPRDEAQERELFLAWLRDVLRAVAQVAAPNEDGKPYAPIHLIFWDEAQRRTLLAGLARHLTAIMGATPLYDFVTQLAAFDSPVASFLQHEIAVHKNYPMVCQSLQAVAAYLKFDWYAPPNYRSLFSARLFDFWGKLEGGGPAGWYTSRARFGSDIPLEFAYAAWDDLPRAADARRDPYAPYRRSTPDLLTGFAARRLEALEHIANSFAGNRQTQQRPFDLTALAAFEQKAHTLAQALDEFVTIERHAALSAWKEARLAAPEQRVLAGETLIARYVEADQDPIVADQNRDHQARQALREQYVAAFRTEHPDAARVTLSGEQRKAVAWSAEGMRVRLRLDLDGVDCGLDEALGLTSLRPGDSVVIMRRFTEDSRLPVEEQTLFTPTPRQLLYGTRGMLAGLRVERDASGRAVAALAEVDLRPPRGGNGWRGFVFGSMAEPFRADERYTLDADPNDWYGFWCAKLTEALAQAAADAPTSNALYDRLTRDDLPSPAWPAAAAAGQARFLAGLDALHALGQFHEFEPSKREYLTEHGGAPLLLVQGPPGTGKSYATAFAVFARLQGAMAADLDHRVLVGCKTHAATDVLLHHLSEARAALGRIAERFPELFASYFDARLLRVPLFRIRPRGDTPEGVIPLPRKEDLPPGALRAADAVQREHWTITAATPGGVYGAIKERWDKGLLGHAFCDLLVLDEASQMNLPEAMMAALPLRADGRLIVVGDHRQMPPIVQHHWDSELRRTFQEFRAYESLFETLRPRGVPMIKFAESFRLHAAMAEFLRQEIYQQDGIAYFSRQDEILPAYPYADPFVAAVLAPDYPLVVVVHDEAASQVRNPFEQALITPVLAALAGGGPQPLGPEHGLGVVVPHRAQRAALQEAIPCLSRTDPATGAIAISAVDTVERFQGSERTAIMVSATESDREYLLTTSEFLLDPRRLTVALSRAKRKMVLVAAQSVFTLFSADDETFAHAQLWKNLLRRTCTQLLWQGERDGRRVTVWGNRTPPGSGAEEVGQDRPEHAVRQQ